MGENVEGVISALKRLSSRELREVYRYMSERMYISLCTPDGSDFCDIARYVGIMSEILDVDIRKRGRNHNLVWGRFIVAHKLLMDGWTTKIVGDALGLDRSTLTNAKHQVESMLSYPMQYHAEFAIYKEFKKRIKDDKMRMAG